MRAVPFTVSQWQDKIATASIVLVFAVPGFPKGRVQRPFTRERRSTGLAGAMLHLCAEDSMERSALLVEGFEPEIASLGGGYNVKGAH